jgi:hypothetical protein
MPEKSAKKTALHEQTKDVMFKCKLCGESKPISELVVLRQYYPVLSSCKECAKGPKKDAAQESQE